MGDELVSVRISVEIFGEEAVTREIMRPAEHVEDMSPAFHGVIKLLTNITRLQFVTAGHGGWAPLSEGRVEEKARLGLDPRTMFASGALFRSLTQPGEGGGAIRTVSNSLLHFGTEVEYGVYQHKGAPSINLPARRLIDVQEGNRVRVVKMLQRYIMTGEV